MDPEEEEGVDLEEVPFNDLDAGSRSPERPSTDPTDPCKLEIAEPEESVAPQAGADPRTLPAPIDMSVEEPDRHVGGGADMLVEEPEEEQGRDLDEALDAATAHTHTGVDRWYDLLVDSPDSGSLLHEYVQEGRRVGEEQGMDLDAAPALLFLDSALDGVTAHTHTGVGRCSGLLFEYGIPATLVIHEYVAAWGEESEKEGEEEMGRRE